MTHPKTLIILPALDEAGNIHKTVTQICLNVPHADVLVVNDGSTDSTAEEAMQAGAIVVNMPYNVGIGAAVQTGFKYAARNGYALVARLDGDGQHSADNTMHLLSLVEDNSCDVAIGSRFLGNGVDYGTSFMRRLGIAILSNLLSLITGQRVTDPTSGFSAYNRRAILLFADYYPHDYPEPEAVVICHKSGLRMQEIPVTFLEREHGTSHFTLPTRSAYYMLKVTLAILVNTLRRMPRVPLTDQV
ncbi:MAG: glycosyltransferase family 2 protein [Chloroflexota bacterium]